MNVSIRYGKVAPDAKWQSDVTSTNYQPFSVFQDLRRDMDDVDVKNWGTCEPNQFILDGSMEHFPDDTSKYDWSYWSGSMSDDTGVFATPPPYLDVSFSALQQSSGITLFFYPFTDDYATSIRVTWYAEDKTTVLHTGIYSGSSVVVEIPQTVINYKRLKIEFLSTNIRNRYIRLWGIEYGLFRTLDNSRTGEINSCVVTEQVSPVAAVAFDNVLNLGLKSFNPEFSLISGKAEDRLLVSRQTLKVVADGKPFGTFFLDDSQAKDVYGTETTFTYTAYSAIWVMKQYQFMGDIYVNALASDVLLQIFKACNMRFKLDDDFDDARISGWIPICNCMEAMQYVCFAIGAIPDPSRRDYVWIYKRDTELKFEMTRYQRYVSGESILSTERYNGVDVTSFEYVAGDETTEVQNGYLAVGQHVRDFSEPLHNLTISGGTVLQSNANYAIINVTSPGEVILTGQRYVVNRQTHSAYESLMAGEVRRIKPYDKCTLMSRARAEIAKNELLDYHLQELIITTKTRGKLPKRMVWQEIEATFTWNQLSKFTWGEIEDGLPISLEPGYIAKSETRGKPIVGTIERMKTNLISGVSEVRIVGNLGQLS